MKKILQAVALAVLTAVFAGCGSMEYQGGGTSGEIHPGHIGHERH